MDFLAGIYGKILSVALLDKRGTSEYLKQELQNILPFSTYTKDLEKSIDVIYEQCEETLANQLTAKLKHAIKTGLKAEVEYEVANKIAKRGLPDNFDQLEENEQFVTIADCLGEIGCIGKNLQRCLRKILTQIFYVYETDDCGHYAANQFARAVYTATLEAEQNFYGDCYDKLQGSSPALVICSYERRTRDVQIRKDKEHYLAVNDEAGKISRAANRDLEQRVIFTLQRLIADGELGIEFEETSLKDLPSFTLGEQNVNAILNMVFEVFSETFADMAACTLLKAYLEDYLLAFVFESWIIDESLTLSTDMKFRIGVMLQLCYADQLNGNGLSDDAKKRIRSALHALEKNGMQKGRIDANDLIERIEDIIRGCAQMKREASPLQEYLQECKKVYDLWSEKAPMQLFQRNFAQMRLYQFQEDKVHEQVISMVEAVTTGRG